MGQLKQVNHTIFLLGIPNSGKTMFLYNNVIKDGDAVQHQSQEQYVESLGFNYEQVGTEIDRFGVYELGGDPEFRPYWSTFYKNIISDGIIFMVRMQIEQGYQKKAHDVLGSDKAIQEFTNSRKCLHTILNEYTLCDVPLVLIYNMEQNDYKTIQNSVQADDEGSSLKDNVLLNQWNSYIRFDELPNKYKTSVILDVRYGHSDFPDKVWNWLSKHIKLNKS